MFTNIYMLIVNYIYVYKQASADSGTGISITPRVINTDNDILKSFY